MGATADAYFERTIDRMNGDVELAFELCGRAACKASTLMVYFSDVSVGGSVELNGWFVRAAALANVANSGVREHLAAVVDAAFDDPDAQVRGVAWCLLADARGLEETRGTVDSCLLNEFAKRNPTGGEGSVRSIKARGLLVALQAIVAVARSREFCRGLDDSYIAIHGASDAQLIQASWASALEFLAHADSGRRLASLRTIARARNSAAAASGRVRQVIESDPDLNVRLAAIVTYGDLQHGTSAPESLRVLARVVLDSAQPMRHRFAAYDGLFKLCGVGLKNRPIDRAAPRSVDKLRDSALPSEWPAEIDWEFVRRCAQAT